MALARSRMLKRGGSHLAPCVRRESGGRFQDLDESAYCEYVLKRAGIRVHYCAKQFENDGSLSSSMGFGAS